MLVGECLEILLVGADLLGLGHLGLLRDTHLRKEHLAQLPRRVDVERRLPGLGADSGLEFGHRAVQFDGIFGQRRAVDPHARHLDVGQHLDHRFLDLEVEVVQSDALDHRQEHLLELQRDVGVLGGVLLHAFDIHQIHRQLLLALANERLDLDGPVVEVAFGQRVHVVPRLGVKQVVEDHRIVLAPADGHAEPPEHHQVELDILTDLGDPRILEYRTDDLCIFGRALLAEGHVPRLVGFDGERHADDAVVEDVEPRRLGVEAELVPHGELADKLPERFGIAHQQVFVGRILRRAELHRVGSLLQLGNGNRTPKRFDGLAEEVALPGQRGLFRRRGLRPGHLGQLALLLLTRSVGQRLGGREVGQIVEEGLEVEFGEERLQIVEVGRTDRELLLAEIDRHVQTNRRQPLGQTEVVAPCGDLLALPPLDRSDVVEDTLDRSPLLHQFAGRLLADARDPRNIVRGVTPQGEDVAHEYRIVDAVLLADGLAVHDLDRPVGTLLLVDAAVFAYQLPVVLVGRHHVDVVAGRSPLLREGADHVVGLIALDFENRDAHGFEHPLDIGHRNEYVLRSLGAVGLVFGEDLAAETATLGIERHAQQVGALTLLDVAEELHEAEDHRGVHSVAVAHRAAQEGVIVLEEQRVGVYQEEFFHSGAVCVASFTGAWNVSCGVVLGEPLGKRRGRLVEPQRMEPDPFRQAGGDAAGEVGEHVLARGLIVHDDDIRKAFPEGLPDGTSPFGVAQDEGVVEARDDLLVHDALEHAEIHHHAVFRVSGIGHGPPGHRDEEPIGVPVNLAARTVVPVECVGRLERKFLGQSDYCHTTKIRKNSVRTT